VIPSTVDRTMSGRSERTDRFEKPELLPSPGFEEVVVDDRASLRPAQVVESKLTRMLQEASLPVSHLQMRGLLRVR
jgi:hypothetical protein